MAMGVLPREALSGFIALGELALDGSITRVPGILPAARHASHRGHGLICPAACGGEAAWAGGHLELVAAPSLLALINHVRGSRSWRGRSRWRPRIRPAIPTSPTSRARRPSSACLAAAGGHNLLMIGPPGSGKSMLAARLPGLLPPLEADEMLEATMVRSLAGETGDGKLSKRRAFRDADHSSTLQALAARRGLAGPSRRAVPRRIAGVPRH
jgi:magnesium chelatase family protein